MLTGCALPRYRGSFMTVNSSVQQVAAGLAAIVGGLILGDTKADAPLTGTQNYLLARVDYTLSSKSSLFVRYVSDRADRSFATGIPLWPELDRTRQAIASLR